MEQYRLNGREDGSAYHEWYENGQIKHIGWYLNGELY